MFSWFFNWYQGYFTHNPGRDGLIYAFVLLIVLFSTTIILLSPWLHPGDCDKLYSSKTYPNPDYDKDLCLDIRYEELMGMTLRECDFGRRMFFAVVFGMLIGYERRSPERAAGIRTMSLTSLGSCCFTLCSMFAFTTGPMAWDASRVSAAIPSGVGFLGAGLIWKGSSLDGSSPQVHGLTTAASVWLSAAVGTAAGGRMYFVCTYVVCLLMVILRFAPRSGNMEHDDEDDDEDQYERESDEEAGIANGLESLGYVTSATENTALLNGSDSGQSPRNSISGMSQTKSRRRRSRGHAGGSIYKP